VSIRVLIADDEALVRQGLSALIQLEGCEVTQTSDGERALALLQEGDFDIALIDIGLPKRSGLDVLNEVLARKLAVRIIILTGDTTRHSPKKVYQAGAAGFLYKTADAEQLLEMFTAVRDGETVEQMLPPSGEQSQSVAEQLELLTQRECQIVKLVVEGSSNKMAAQVLSLSEHTVRKHREHINSKLKLKTPAALALFAIRCGLV